MIHYTPLDPMEIWTDPTVPEPVLEEEILDGVRVVLRQEDGMSWSVVQIISTDPQDFLRPQLQPGTQIRKVPTTIRQNV